MYGTLTDFEPLELQFDLFLVRTKVLRVSLKPNNSSIKRIRIKNDFFCSVISKLRDETKTRMKGGRVSKVRSLLEEL